jgi:hypothetical protein
MLEFDASVIGRELPVGFGVVGIAVGLPSGDASTFRITRARPLVE